MLPVAAESLHALTGGRPRQMLRLAWQICQLKRGAIPVEFESSTSSAGKTTTPKKWAECLDAVANHLMKAAIREEPSESLDDIRAQVLQEARRSGSWFTNDTARAWKFERLGREVAAAYQAKLASGPAGVLAPSHDRGKTFPWWPLGRWCRPSGGGRVPFRRA